MSSSESSLSAEYTVECSRVPEGRASQIYDRFGFVFIKDVISQAKIHGLRNEIRTLISFSAIDGEDLYATISRLDQTDQKLLYSINQTINKLMAIEEIHGDVAASFQAMFSGPQVCSILLTRGILMGLPRDNRLVYGWHQESNYLPGVGVPILSSWAPIFEPSTVENGAMSVLSGSHQLGRLDYKKEGGQDNSYLQLAPDDERFLESDFDNVVCCLSPGDIVIFDENMVHRSNYNATDKTRITLVSRMLFASKMPERLTFGRELY